MFAPVLLEVPGQMTRCPRGFGAYGNQRSKTCSRHIFSHVPTLLTITVSNPRSVSQNRSTALSKSQHTQKTRYKPVCERVMSMSTNERPTRRHAAESRQTGNARLRSATFRLRLDGTVAHRPLHRDRRRRRLRQLQVRHRVPTDRQRRWNDQRLQTVVGDRQNWCLQGRCTKHSTMASGARPS